MSEVPLYGPHTSLACSVGIGVLQASPHGLPSVSKCEYLGAYLGAKSTLGCKGISGPK